MDIGAIWDLIILQPMINIIIGLSNFLFGNLGLAIIALTVVVRGLMYPLTMKQLNATKAMRDLQPKIAELQKKHGKDKQKLAEEQMKLYKESGVSPAGCLMPLLLQMPVWIALYQSIIRVLAINPENFLNLSRYLYDWPVVYSALPLSNHFLWMNLAYPDFFVAILVGASLWVQQKMIAPTSADPKQQAQGRTMQVMMPLMFAFLSLSFPSGLALYWLTTNIISIAIQYFVTGWGDLLPARSRKVPGRDKKLRKRIAEVEQAPTEITAPVADITEQGEEAEDERGRDERQDRGGGYPASLRKIRRKPRRGRSRRSKRR